MLQCRQNENVKEDGGSLLKAEVTAAKPLGWGGAKDEVSLHYADETYAVPSELTKGERDKEVNLLEINVPAGVSSGLRR